MVLKKTNIFNPTKKIVAPNDTFAKKLFTLSDKEWYAAFEGADREISESKKIQLTSKYSLQLRHAVKLDKKERENLYSPLNMFDRAIMTALVSEWIAGNVEVTIPSIWRLITGKPSGQGLTPSTLQADAILASVKKLACVHFLQADLSDVCKKFKYNDGKPLSFNYTPLIDCTISNEVFCCQDAQIISINTEPILYTIAKAKKQVLTFSRDWLYTDVKIRFKTYAVIKFYTAVRVAEIYGSKKLTETITYEDIFKKCGLSDASYKVLRSVRHAILGVLSNIQSDGVLKSFEVVREGNGKKFTKINLTYERLLES